MELPKGLAKVDKHMYEYKSLTQLGSNLIQSGVVKTIPASTTIKFSVNYVITQFSRFSHADKFF